MGFEEMYAVPTAQRDEVRVGPLSPSRRGAVPDPEGGAQITLTLMYLVRLRLLQASLAFFSLFFLYATSLSRQVHYCRRSALGSSTTELDPRHLTASDIPPPSVGVRPLLQMPAIHFAQSMPRHLDSHG